MQTSAIVPNADVVRDKIAERIRTAFVELIPDEQWKAVVDAEIKRFSEPTCDRYRNDQPSPLQAIIRSELETSFRGAIKAELNKPEYLGNWIGSDQTPSEFVSDFLVKHSDVMIRAALGSVTQGILDNIRRSIGDGM